MKSERVNQLELILKAHPEGLRKADIARRIGVHRSTVGRYINELKNFSDVYEDDSLVKIEQSENTDEKIDLTVYESLALNMGAQMLLNSTEFQSQHLASALRKIAMNLKACAPKIANNIVAIAEESEFRSRIQSNNTQYNMILEVIIDAWVSGRMIKIKHSQGKDITETELAPYFIGFVDSEQGRSPITLTGRLRHTKEIVTIDISTIRTVDLLNETYTIPDNLKPFAKAEEVASVNTVIDTVHLQLKVNERSALNSFKVLAHGEIKETKLVDGSLKCSFDAENSIELILRIIQCGNSVEVLAPENFRQKFVKTLNQILKIYNNDKSRG